MTKHAIDRLQLRINEVGNPACLGLDPHVVTVPDFLFEEGKVKYDNLSNSLEYALFEFGRRLIDATADLLPAVKLQLAFYEMYGVAGMKALERTMLHAREKGMLVIADAKRGDIGSTCEAYAQAFLAETRVGDHSFRAFPADIMTVQPYTGWDGVKPFLDTAVENDAGLFLLCRTSNPSASDLQGLKLADGRTVMEVLADLITQWGANSLSEEYNLSALGAVVAATYPEEARNLRSLMPQTFFLVPGYGAQGAGPDDAVAGFRADGSGAIVSASRSMATAYKKFAYPIVDFDLAARAEVLEMKEKLNLALQHRAI
ncbi:MAG: orotidine-5'-phosphate decarboxylase [Eubacteriales bacterium]|nr:orotidine-5'-phosphate decarboxylase [Eubacteriales bacterium]MDD4541952.1 orotidine-5'-phosphate decarboxylase [Eubacteriales bacterium]